MKSIRTALSLACVGILILGLALTACSPAPPGEIVYYDETKILTEEEAENIEEVTGNRSSILFSETTAFVAGLEPGDILVYEHGVPGAEYGLLERVTGVSTMEHGLLEGVTGLADGGTVVEIEPATMEDAIEKGEFPITETIPLEDLLSDATWATGVEVLQTPEGGHEFSYNPTEGVAIQGYLLFPDDADVHIDIRLDSGLKEFEFRLSAGLEMEATLTVESGVTWEPEPVTIGTVSGPPIPIWGPVVIIPTITVVVGTSGEFNASFEAAVTYDRAYEVGFTYDRDRTPRWEPINQVYGEGADFEDPSFNGHVEALVFGGVELSGKAGIPAAATAALGAELLGNIRASGERGTSPWQWQYDLELYLSASVFVDLYIWGIADKRWETDTWQYPTVPYSLAYGASGRVTTEGDEGLADVEINFSNGYSSVLTDEDGYWRKHLLSGDVVATPDKSGYSFDPPSRTITGSASNLDFQTLMEEYNPLLYVEKTGPPTAAVDDLVTYTISVTHGASSDNSPVLMTGVTDDIAGAATYTVGDTDMDGYLDYGETWTYEVHYTIQPDDPDPLINVSTASGTDGDGDTISRSDNHSLDVTTRALEITADSNSKVYDGTPLTDDGYSITAGSLAPGHTLDSVTVTGSQTDVGSSDNVPSAAVILDGAVDVTANYDITYVNGTLTVTVLALEITADSNSKMYDGTPLTDSGYTITGGALAAGHTLVSVTVTGSQTDVGSSPNVPSAAAILDGAVDVTANYDITYVNGTLTVTNVTDWPLEITAASDSKPYDGTPLTDSGYSITSGTLLPGHSLVSVTVTGSQTDVGSSPNVPSNAVIMDNGDDVTSSYDITYVNGTLTVTGEIVYDEEYVDQDSFVMEFDPDANLNGLEPMLCGEQPGGYRNWVFLKFDFDDVVIPESADIEWARLWIHVDGALGTTFGYTRIQRVIESWSETTITWEYRPNFNAGHYYSTAIGSSGWHYRYITNYVRGWRDETYENHGLILRLVENTGLLMIDDMSVNGAYIELKWQQP